ncbi:hypothetical protein Klosneuvirus_3_271 [Klosneuvirus KNV1]|uniref:Uncharacterized protein n=1 Tax=Klosneuvirus KNV1 TaxID=1977640 RepID=A0A1V0SK94_9VIRU|nr:hypothetical protein Klosneuvirus_3_271 [Klosneuvirus KNV1]
MAHLPKEIVELCTPLLFDYALETLPNFGYSFKLFDILTENARVEDEYKPPGLGEELHKYHWWFVSFGSFKTKHYAELEKRIKVFNQLQDQCKLILNFESGGHARRICHSDSDNYGTYYFLITAVKPDGNPFDYTVPKSCLNELKDAYQFKYNQKTKIGLYDICYPEIKFTIIPDGEYRMKNYQTYQYITSSFDMIRHDPKRETEPSLVEYTQKNYNSVVKIQEKLKENGFSINLNFDIINNIKKRILNKHQEKLILEIIHMDPTSQEFQTKWKEVQKIGNHL